MLRTVGFCGADDSVHPHMLALINRAYPLVEFGVLFRPDLEGRPRYATTAWVQGLAATAQAMAAAVSPSSGGNVVMMKLAAHLCGSRVDDLLEGRGRPFLDQLVSWGFQRVQINATQVNQANTSHLDRAGPVLRDLALDYPQVEFIIQKNEETKPLWSYFVSSDATEDAEKQPPRLPANISMLVDESKGTGVAASSWPKASAEYRIGYAGGIGPSNIRSVLSDLQQAAGEYPFWIDMESSLRSVRNGQDIFDLDKCYQVIQAVCEAGLMIKPAYLD